jgi:hypothetical protein
MKSFGLIVPLLFGVILAAGCASTKVTQQTPLVNPTMARPNQIWVYDFIAASGEVPADSSIGGDISAPSTPPTAAEIQQCRRFGAMSAQSLVEDIQAMGLPALRGTPNSNPQVGDGVIRGYICLGRGWRRWQRGQALRHRVWRRDFGDGYGGGRLCDDAPRFAQTWVGDA